MMIKKIRLYLNAMLLMVFTTVGIFSASVTSASNDNKLIIQTENSSDDSRNITNSNRGDTMAATHYMGEKDGKKYVHGVRFAGVTLPENATIEKAELQFYSAGDISEGELELIFKGEKTNDSVTFRIGHNTPENREVSISESRNLPTISTWSTQGFSNDTTIDVTNIVTEIVSETNWKTGDPITIIQSTSNTSTGYVSYSTYDRDASRAPRLIISYKTSIITGAVAKIKSFNEKIDLYKSERNIMFSREKQDVETMAWIYPGEPACSTKTEYSDERSIYYLKPEYFTLSDKGDLTLLTEADAGCNAYSEDNISSLKNNSEHIFVTVSGSGDKVKLFLERNWNETESDINTLVNFTVENDVDGIEIDYEGFGSWNEQTYRNYLGFINELGLALQKKDKKLMVDVPPIGNEREQSYYHLTYEDMASLPIDYITIMAYDYQYDHGSGKSIAPNAWVIDIINHAKKYIDQDRLVIGVPAYGYYGKIYSYDLKVTNSSEIKAKADNIEFTRDPYSYEMIGQQDDLIYVYQDQESLDKKRKLIESLGVKYISVWALGGNEWFTK